MPVPDYQTFMLPVLRFAADKADQDVSLRELLGAMSREFSLSDDDMQELLPSGTQTTFANRVHWACTYLKKAGLLSAPRRAHLRVTPRGQSAISRNPVRIDIQFLKQFPEFVVFQQTKGTRSNKPASEAAGDQIAGGTGTPMESLEAGYQSLRAELKEEVLAKVKSCSPAFFEQLVVELLLKMGYGGSRSDAGRALGRSGDEGIDGIIKEDKLGLDTIYLQAKRWAEKTVGRPDVQQFQGALSGHGAVKGIFITTSQFSKEASDYAAGLRHGKIVLIDGDELAELMIDHGIGVASSVTYEVKRIDSDYFFEGDEQ